MTELAVTAASAALAFLVLYGAAVMFTLERIGDRFGPTLLPGFLRRRVAGWFVGLASLVLAGLVVIVPPDGPGKLLASLVLFLADSALVALACYRTWRDGSDVRGMLELAHGAADPAQAVREILWQALERADVVTVGLSLRAFDRTSPLRADLLAWLLGHRVLQDRDWLTTEILSAELEGGLDEAGARAVREPLIAILDSALRREQFELVYNVIHETIEALEEAAPFTDSHGQLMVDVGSKTWLVGDYYGTAPRKASVPAQLDYVKGIYSSRLKDIWRAILNRREVEGVESFVSFLCLSAEETEETQFMYSIYTDILMDGAPAGVLTMKPLRDLANSMRHIRLREEGRAFRGEPDEDGLSSFEAPGESWNRLFVLLVDAAQKSGATEHDIEQLVSTYGMASDRDFMRKVKRELEERRSAESGLGHEVAPRRSRSTRGPGSEVQ